MRQILFQTPRSRRGLTLVELIAVLAVLAILLAVAIPALGAQQKQTAALVCEGNRRSAEAELALAQARGQQSELERILDQYRNACPSGGTYYEKSVDGQIHVFCMVHAGDIVEVMYQTYGDLSSGNNYKTDQGFIDFMKSNGYGVWYSNDWLRKYFISRDGGWPTLIYQGVTYYVQPFVANRTTSQTPENYPQAFVYANKENIPTTRWWANLFYVDGVWYYYTTGEYKDQFTSLSMPDVANIVQGDDWKALSSSEYVITPPNPANPPQYPPK